MTVTIQIAFGRAVMRIVPIYFVHGASNGAVRKLPLGVMADLCVGSMYGLGLMAREAVGQDELINVGEFVRPIIARPNDFLLKEFNRVYSSVDPVAVFSDLPRVHSTSLRFEMPSTQQITVPKPVAVRSVASECVLETWMRDQLKRELSDGWWKLVEQWTDDQLHQRKEIEEVKRIAAVRGRLASCRKGLTQVRVEASEHEIRGLSRQADGVRSSRERAQPDEQDR